MRPPLPNVAARDVDRFRELTNIGAGHAAGALAGLIGRTCWMSVPKGRMLRDGCLWMAETPEPERPRAGVFFEVNGGLRGFVAMLFPADVRDRLLEVLVGRPAAEVPPDLGESAISEVGNILVSHVVSAMAETIDVVLKPSVPALSMQDAPAVLESRLASRIRSGQDAVLCFQTEISDHDGDFRGVLIFVPDTPKTASAS